MCGVPQPSGRTDGVSVQPHLLVLRVLKGRLSALSQLPDALYSTRQSFLVIGCTLGVKVLPQCHSSLIVLLIFRSQFQLAIFAGILSTTTGETIFLTNLEMSFVSKLFRFAVLS